MARVFVNIDGFKRQIKRLEKVLDTDKLKDEMIEIAIKQIQGQTRSGNDLASGGKQASLAPSTVEQREYLAKHNTTHPSYKKARSNLTLTGQLLDSLVGQKFRGFIKIVLKGTRKPYRKGSRKSRTNNFVAAKLKEQGRQFLGKSPLMTKQIKIAIQRFIRRALRKT